MFEKNTSLVQMKDISVVLIDLTHCNVCSGFCATTNSSLFRCQSFKSVSRISYYQTEINICDFNIELLVNIYTIQITNVSLYLMLIVVHENTNFFLLERYTQSVTQR